MRVQFLWLNWRLTDRLMPPIGKHQPAPVDQDEHFKTKSGPEISPCRIASLQLIVECPLCTPTPRMRTDSPILNQHRELELRQLAIGMLGSLLLGCDDQPCRTMRGTHGTVGLVHMLAAWATGPHRLIVDILVPQIGDRISLWRDARADEPIATLVMRTKSAFPLPQDCAYTA